jgi:uncharacterized protein with FMN-binding domain
MRRSPYVIAATLAGVAGVLAYQARHPAGGSTSARTAARAPAERPARQRQRPSTSTPAPAPSGVHQATGKLVPYGYGELAVQVTASGKKITSVRVATLRTADQYSQQLADQVIPTLRSEVLSAQSARINVVSGATYTSEAYASSLQSALATLHA